MKKLLTTMAVALGILTPTQTLAATGDDIIKTADKYLGAKYVFGASPDRTDIFDCSSFVQRVFKENGIDLPRTTREQIHLGEHIPPDQLQKGDLLFFDTNRDGVVNHVGIYVSPNYMINAQTSKGVAYANTQYYWNKYHIKSVRVLDNTSVKGVTEKKTETANIITHTVVSGDTLWGISRKYGTTVDKIKSDNKLTSTVIYPNQKLIIK